MGKPKKQQRKKRIKKPKARPFAVPIRKVWITIA